MSIEIHFNIKRKDQIEPFITECKSIRGLYVQKYRRNSSIVAVKVSGELLTQELADKLLAGRKNYATNLPQQ